MTVKEDPNGLVTQIYDCYIDNHDFTTTICSLVTADSVTKCCNSTDLCNKYLNVTLPEATPQPTSEVQPTLRTNGSEGKYYNSYRYILVYIAEVIHC